MLLNCNIMRAASKNIMLMKALITKARLKDLLNKIDAAFETKQNFGAREIEDYKKTLKFP